MVVMSQGLVFLSNWLLISFCLLIDILCAVWLGGLIDSLANEGVILNRVCGSFWIKHSIDFKKNISCVCVCLAEMNLYWQ